VHELFFNGKSIEAGATSNLFAGFGSLGLSLIRQNWKWHWWVQHLPYIGNRNVPTVDIQSSSILRKSGHPSLRWESLTFHSIDVDRMNSIPFHIQSGFHSLRIFIIASLCQFFLRICFRYRFWSTLSRFRFYSLSRFVCSKESELMSASQCIPQRIEETTCKYVNPREREEEKESIWQSRICRSTEHKVCSAPINIVLGTKIWVKSLPWCSRRDDGHLDGIKQGAEDQSCRHPDSVFSQIESLLRRLGSIVKKHQWIITLNLSRNGLPAVKFHGDLVTRLRPESLSYLFLWYYLRQAKFVTSKTRIIFSEPEPELDDSDEALLLTLIEQPFASVR
jgi:hypothetical protein